MAKNKKWGVRSRVTLADVERRQEARRELEVTRRIEALRQQVHPAVPLACRDCGHLTDTEPATVRLVANLAGDNVPLGHCMACTANSGRIHRHAIGLVLGVDSKARELAGLTVELFQDRPGLRAGRHNSEPWQHLDADVLGQQVKQARDRLAARRSAVPCWYCGVDTTPPRTIWRDEPVQRGRRVCGGCWAMFGSFAAAPLAGDQRRGVACAELLGLNTATRRVVAVSLASELGFVYWGEVPRDRANARPWAHIDLPALYRGAIANRDFRAQHPNRVAELSALLTQAEAGAA